MPAETLLTDDLQTLSHASLDAALTELCSHLNAAEYRLLQLIREWDARELCGHYGVRSTAHWLNYKCGIALGAAREKVRVARALESLPATSELLRRGEISYSKVRALTRVATADNETYLLGIALNGTASHMERLVSSYKRVERLRDPERILRQRRDRGLSWYFDEDGMLVIHGRFAPEDGALLVKAIEAMKDRMFREERAGESGDSLIATHGRVEEDVACMSRARRADALLRVVEEGMHSGPNPLSGPERMQVVLHVPVRGKEADGNGNAATVDCSAAIPNPDRTLAAHAQLDPGGVIPMATARRLACDASCVEHHENERGETVSIGRSSRLVPAWMRRALLHRDGGCRFPGCTQRHYVDAHHILHWAEGGETGLDNLVLLCRRHHRLVHEEGFACERTPQGKIRFRMPDGAVLPEAFRLKPGSFPDIADVNRAFGLNVSAETCNAGWNGQHMDLGLAVELLWNRTHRPGPFPLPPRRRPKNVPDDPPPRSGSGGDDDLLWTPVFTPRRPD